jgi:CRP/FNR family transcriptional regulator, cyclic AMP receptor protein
MLTISEAIGFFASTLVLATFTMKDMRTLRIIAIFSNIAFITYGMLDWLPPVFGLHLLLLPLNILRLKEIHCTAGARPASRHELTSPPIRQPQLASGGG